MASDEVYKLNRNDVDGAVKLAKKLIQDGEYSPADEEVLVKLQDNPDKLMDELEKVYDELVGSEDDEKWQEIGLKT